MTDTNKPVRLIEEGADAPPPGIDPDLIAAVEVELEAVLGKTKISVAELMKLQKGSTLALDSSLERDVELRLNGVTVARGELVAVGDQFGVRILEIIK